MRRTTFALLLVCLVASVAVAANVQFKKGSPTFSVTATTVTASGDVAGVGNQDVTVILEATGTGTVTCVNKGGTEAPGQNKVPVNVTATQTVSQDKIKNGTFSFNLTTPLPRDFTAKEGGCPNSNWTAKVSSVVFTSATLTFKQGGKVVLQQTLTF